MEFITLRLGGVYHCDWLEYITAIWWSVSMGRGVKARLEFEGSPLCVSCKGIQRATILSGHGPIHGRESAANLILKLMNPLFFPELHPCFGTTLRGISVGKCARRGDYSDRARLAVDHQPASQ